MKKKRRTKSAGKKRLIKDRCTCTTVRRCSIHVLATQEVFTMRDKKKNLLVAPSRKSSRRGKKKPCIEHMKCHSTHSAQGKRTLNSEAAHHRLLLPRTFFEYSSQVKESYHVRRCDCTPTYFELTSKDSVAKKQKKTIRVILKQEVTEKQTSNQRKKEQKRRWMSMYRSSFMLASTHTHKRTQFTASAIPSSARCRPGRAAKSWSRKWSRSDVF